MRLWILSKFAHAFFSRFSNERLHEPFESAALHCGGAKVFDCAEHLRGTDRAVCRCNNKSPASGDEIRNSAARVRALANLCLDFRERSIRRANTLELSINDDRVRGFNNQLSVVHIRLGDDCPCNAGLREVASNAVVVETRFVVHKLLDADCIRFAPIAKRVRDETA